MNDTSKNVRAYIYSQLNGNITHDASAVSVVAKPTDLTSYPYIVVQSSNFAATVVSAFELLRPYFDYMSDVLTTDLNGESIL